MNAVVFYSNTRQSEAVARYLARELKYPLIAIETAAIDSYQDLVLVFPVHCQNIPDPVKAFLKRISVMRLSVIATYGKMCCGNVLYEIQRKYHSHIVAAAYIPTKHAYLTKDRSFDAYDSLRPIIEKIQAPAVIRLPKRYKNPLADIFPKQRSRLGLKIKKNQNCTGCNCCAAHCSLDAIRSGTVNHRCIGCLKCVTLCPRQALKVTLRFPLRWYLHKKKTDKLILYL